MDALDEFLVKNFNPVGFDEDRLKLVLYFYLILPFGFLFRKIQDPFNRLVFNLILGLSFTAWLGKGWFIFINSVTIAIYIMTRIKNPFYPVFILSFSALAYVHIYRLMYDYLQQKFDFNVIQMMITCRYIYYVVDFDKEKRNTFLSYYSYIFMFTNLIIGPVPYKDFMKLINNEIDQTHYKYSFALKTFVFAILFSAGEVFIRPHLDLDWIHTEAWANMNIIQRNLFLLIIAVAIRFRYFCAFKHTQAGMDAIGISYNPETRQCDKFLTADYTYETEKNALLKTSKWNCLVQQWLKYCFYDRLSKKLGNSAFYAVYVISAIWHGFYLQYYLFFVCWAIVNQNMKYFFKAQRKFYFIPQTIRHFLAWLYSTVVINDFALAVVLLDWNLGMQYFKQIYWTPHILTGIVFLFFFTTGYGQKETKKIK